MSKTPAAPTVRKRGRPTAAERAQRRDDILDAAVRLFVDQGFEAVTLDHIAAAARVTKRTIYSYLGDRTEVFLAAVERLGARTMSEAASDDVLAGLAKKIVHTLHSDEAVGLHRMVIAEATRFPELAGRFYDDGPQRYIGLIADRLPGGDRLAANRRAEALFTLLLGEPHRQRLLGLRSAPDEAEAAWLADSAVRQLGLVAEDTNSAGPLGPESW